MRKTLGIVKSSKGYRCIQCGNEDSAHFYQYFSSILNKEVIYCRQCIHLGRMDNITEYKIIKSKNH